MTLIRTIGGSGFVRAAIAATISVGCQGGSRTGLTPEASEGAAPSARADEPTTDAATESAEVWADAASVHEDSPSPNPSVSLRLNPDESLVPAAMASIEAFATRFGLTIELATDGIPVTVADHVYHDGGEVDGLAHYDHWCAGYECSAGHGVSIVLSKHLLFGKGWALQTSLDHEIAHVLSGWGRSAGKPLHLPPKMGLLSPGCVDHVCVPWSELDAELICAGSPCAWIRLDNPAVEARK